MDRAYYELTLVQFGTRAEVDPRCCMTPVRKIDVDNIQVRGNGGGTNITEALELTYHGLAEYVPRIMSHAERSEHPLPLVLLFSDGQNGFGDPIPVAKRIKELNVDGDPVVIACAGVSTDTSDQPDEQLLRAIASPECYLHVDKASLLTAFLAQVGSSGLSSPAEIGRVIRLLEDKRGVED